MSEQQPLLLVHGIRHSATTTRSKVASLLESQQLHKLVISLVVIDTICVLADLIYTFLSPGCNPTDLPPWLEGLAHISLGITIIFLIEIPAALWAFGLRYYNPFGQITHAALHLFDAVVVITTFTLEVILRGRERELAGMLVVLRLWRLVKLVGGVAVGTGEVGEEDARRLEEMREQLDKAKRELQVVQEDNAALKRQLASFRQQS